MTEVPIPARRARRVLPRVAVTVIVLLATVAAGLFAITERLGDTIVRIPAVFTSLEEVLRPPGTPGQTFLLVGEDSRPAPDASGDALVLARVSADRGSVTVVSVPGDVLVDVPGRGRAAVGGTYADGGPALVVQTVEALTATRVDHVAVVDLARSDAVVDALDGVDLPGAGRLDGAGTTAYLDRAGAGGPDRSGRQQAVLRAVLAEVVSGGTLTDPMATWDLLDAVSRSVRLDDTLTNGGLRTLAVELRGVRPGDFTLLAAPVVDPAGPAGAAELDARATELWDALRTGDAAGYAGRHPEDLFAPLPG